MEESRQQEVKRKRAKSRGNRVVGSSIMVMGQLVEEKEMGVLDI